MHIEKFKKKRSFFFVENSVIIISSCWLLRCQTQAKNSSLYTHASAYNLTQEALLKWRVCVCSLVLGGGVFVMDAQFATKAWATNTPFETSSVPRPSTAMSAISKGSTSGVGHRSSESGMAAGWSDGADGSTPAVYAADSLGGNLSDNNKAGALVDRVAITSNYSGALAKTNPATMAVAMTCPSVQLRQSPFSGLYDDVDFPVHTLFSPPRPPGELLPRARRPNRNKAPVYANDITCAGTREHEAQCEVSRIWRGVLCRRRLRQARAMNDMLNERARVIQCWWRCMLARWRRRQLSALRSEWAKERAAQYVAERVLNTTNLIYWQRRKFDGAALRIQQAVRWHLRRRQRQRCAEAQLPESEWPPALARPVAERRRPYFPWRHRQSTPARVQSGALVAAAEDANEVAAAAAAAPSARRTLLWFSNTPREVLPPTQAEVEAINAQMRAKQAQRAAALQTPEALSRMEWKAEGLRQEDLDFNAGVVQRLYRSKHALETVHTKDLTAAYFNKVARTIARAFRMYILIKRMHAHQSNTAAAAQRKNAQRSADKITELKTEAVWQKDLMVAAATSIQRCWAWYRYRHDGVIPASYRAANTVPTPPCYGLIQAHIEREHALRWSTMNLLEQRQYEEQRHHKFLRYVPQKVELYEHTGLLFINDPPASPTKVETEQPCKGCESSVIA